MNKSVEIRKEEIVRSNLTKKDLGTEKEKVFYKELEKSFVEEFPDYQISYMITYGPHGLVQNLLK